MKILAITSASLLSLLICFYGLQMAASERIEVVELHTKNAEGEKRTTRVWVVDYNGHAFIRAGHAGSGWFKEIQINQTIDVTRHNVTKRFRAIAKPQLKAAINDLMQAKYTWGDAFIGAVFGRADTIPIELSAI